jgi:arylamine N-acetyltransferase
MKGLTQQAEDWSGQHLTPHQADRYLSLLGLIRRNPDLAFLSEIVSAHMIRIPFENISKLYYLKKFGVTSLLDLDTYLDGIEQYHFGGTCYTNNIYLNLLMNHLGFDAMLCGADMSSPDVHIVSIVKLDGREYIVDVGYGAPFLTPLPRDLASDFEVELGSSRYVLKPQDVKKYSRLDMYKEGELKHGYTAKPIPRTPQFFNTVIDNSFQPQATFMNALLLVRVFPNRSIMINSSDLIISEGHSSTKKLLSSRQEIAGAINTYCDIPLHIIEVSMSQLGHLGNAWT